MNLLAGGVKLFGAKIGRPEGVTRDDTDGTGWKAT